MNNRSVYEKIIAKGEEEALKIKQQGQEKAKSMTEQIMDETEQRIHQLLSNVEAKNADLMKTKQAELEQSKKQLILTNQKRIIKETFHKALEKLCTINDETLTTLVISCLKQADLTGEEILFVNEKEKVRYQNLFSSKQNNHLDNLSKWLNQPEFHITLSNQAVNIQGGFLIEGTYYDIDYSYENILENLETELETKVAEMLFRNEA